MENEESTAPPVQEGGVIAPPQMHEYPRAQWQHKDANTDPLRFVVPVNPSIWALAAGYFGLGSVLLVFAPFALLFGILGLRDIKANPTKTGKGRAWFGVIMGALGCGVIILIIVLSIVQRK